jgi:hypothetical protein
MTVNLVVDSVELTDLLILSRFWRRTSREISGLIALKGLFSEGLAGKATTQNGKFKYFPKVLRQKRSG